MVLLKINTIFCGFNRTVQDSENLFERYICFYIEKNQLLI